MNSCNRPECQAEWKKWTDKTESQEENDYLDDIQPYALTHCCTKDCHEIYWRGKNGSTCEKCSGNFCEGCTMYKSPRGDAYSDDDEFICRECLEENDD